MQLPTVDDCAGCGVCCMHMAVPPYSSDERLDLPPQVCSDLFAVEDSRELQLAAHGCDFIPCGFFSMIDRRCSHYEHRPEICRDFELGGESCLQHRKDAGVQ